MDVYPYFEKNEIFAKIDSHDLSSSISERKPHKKYRYSRFIDQESMKSQIYMAYIIGFFFIVELEGSFWSIGTPLAHRALFHDT